MLRELLHEGSGLDANTARGEAECCISVEATPRVGNYISAAGVAVTSTALMKALFHHLQYGRHCYGFMSDKTIGFQRGWLAARISGWWYYKVVADHKVHRQIH